MWRLGNGKYAVECAHPVNRNLAQAMAELERLSSKVSISPPIREKASVSYRKALDKGLVRGRSINAIAAAALYAACRKSGSPRTLREIAEASPLMREILQDATDCFLQELDFHMPVSDPLTYVSKIAEKTGISGRTQGAAIAILSWLDKNEFQQEKTLWV